MSLKKIVLFLLIAFCFSNCGNKKLQSKEINIAPIEKVVVLIPFLPGDCHQCNDRFANHLKALDARKIEYKILMRNEYSDDLDYIKKEYQLINYRNSQFVFSDANFEKYHIYEQSFVLQFGVDSNYKVYDNANSLIEGFDQLNKTEVLSLGDYKFKKSTSNIIGKSIDQICFESSVQTNTFDYLNLKNNNPKSKKISFTDQQLFNNYISYFKDSATAKTKLNEVKKFGDIPDKERFEEFEYYNDTLFVSSSQTYIASLVDSVLKGFLAINVYKNGAYISSRAINNEHLPPDYYIIPTFYGYNGKMYFKVVKEELSLSEPNYFLAEFELQNGAYHFKKFLNFTLPSINTEAAGYTFLDLRFSGRYCMTSISNTLFDLETEQTTILNIPTNERIEQSTLSNDLKGVNIVIQNINVQFPNLLISYFSKDQNGVVKAQILNYNLENKNIVGKIRVSAEDSRYLEPDRFKFGYFLWMPQKGNNEYLMYKKLF